MKIEVPRERIEEFCRKWHVSELALFGSVLRDDFRPDSDVDVLVTFEPGVRATFRSWLAMEDELRQLYGRPVDLVEKSSVTNPFRRHHILRNHAILYAA
ncbi:nucleotidyltransferase family protein [Longimicrobium sp.]|uniref:nucleotidyltransferase family protein n=1 Tax=Longimicrobium sp. TaxID=2029185 RepID=UPI002B98D2C0|nr:nucleotidyltransferase family protein [Longimicrobium sp.]HSU16675.1 nucleotidyltransferase family protein [Longimicrobium sp.]